MIRLLIEMVHHDESVGHRVDIQCSDGDESADADHAICVLFGDVLVDQIDPGLISRIRVVFHVLD